jgi:hypothetical protein
VWEGAAYLSRFQGGGGGILLEAGCCLALNTQTSASPEPSSRCVVLSACLVISAGAGRPPQLQAPAGCTRQCGSAGRRLRQGSSSTRRAPHDAAGTPRCLRARCVGQQGGLCGQAGTVACCVRARSRGSCHLQSMSSHLRQLMICCKCDRKAPAVPCCHTCVRLSGVLGASGGVRQQGASLQQTSVPHASLLGAAVHCDSNLSGC